MESCKHVGTSMINGHKLSSKDEMPIVQKNKRKSIIGALKYLTHIRIDIENVVGIVSRFQDDLKESHYAIVKRIFSYLKGTLDFLLWYDRSSDFTLSACTNVV